MLILYVLKIIENKPFYTLIYDNKILLISKTKVKYNYISKYITYITKISINIEKCMMKRVKIDGFHSI